MPNTPGIMNAIKTMCQAQQVSGSQFFPSGNVIVGRFKDVVSNVPCLEITGAEDETTRYSDGSRLIQGGKIDDSQYFLIEVTLDLTDAQAAETQLALIRDALTQTFHTSAQLNTPGVAFSGIVKGSGRRGYVSRQGQLWRIYQFKLKVRFEYAVIIVQ